MFKRNIDKGKVTYSAGEDIADSKTKFNGETLSG